MRRRQYRRRRLILAASRLQWGRRVNATETEGLTIRNHDDGGLQWGRRVNATETEVRVFVDSMEKVCFNGAVA